MSNDRNLANLLGTSTTVPSSTQPAGAVLQVKSGSIATAVNTTESTFQDSSLAVTITPSSSSNKIFVIAQFSLYAVGASTAAVGNVKRGSTSLSSAVTGLGYIYNTHTQIVSNVTACVLDTPATTSATTYTVQWCQLYGGTAYLCPGSSPSVLTLMEIAG